MSCSSSTGFPQRVRSLFPVDGIIIENHSPEPVGVGVGAVAPPRVSQYELKLERALVASAVPLHPYPQL